MLPMLNAPRPPAKVERKSRPPQPSPKKAIEPDTRSFTDKVELGLRTTARFALGALGATAGAVAGAVAGAAVGAGIGGVIGWQGKVPLQLEFLRPLSDVAGLGGKAAQNKLEPLVGKTAAGVLGAAAGIVSGAVIGTLGTAWAGVDLGARLASKLVAPGEKGPDNDPRPTYERGWGAQIPTPDGEIEEDQHHFLYNTAAFEVLENDAKVDPEMAEINDFLNSDPEYKKNIQMGGWNLDTFLGTPLPGVSPSTFHHFTEAFMPGFKTAAWQTRQCYDKAADAWKAGDRSQAMYYLGAAVHLPQDVSLPQHAVSQVAYIGKMLGHQMMEHWAESQFDRLKPADDAHGRYIDANTPEEYVAKVSAESTSEYGDAVKDAWRYVEHRVEKQKKGLPTDDKSQTDFDSEPYANTMKRAVEITPGFFRMFFRDMKAQGYPINA